MPGEPRAEPSELRGRGQVTVWEGSSGCRQAVSGKGVWHNVINDDFIIVCMTRWCTYVPAYVYIECYIDTFQAESLSGQWPATVLVRLLSHFPYAGLIRSLLLTFVMCFNFKIVFPCLSVCVCVCSSCVSYVRMINYGLSTFWCNMMSLSSCELQTEPAACLSTTSFISPLPYLLLGSWSSFSCRCQRPRCLVPFLINWISLWDK